MEAGTLGLWKWWSAWRCVNNRCARTLQNQMLKTTKDEHNWLWTAMWIHSQDPSNIKLTRPHAPTHQCKSTFEAIRAAFGHCATSRCWAIASSRYASLVCPVRVRAACCGMKSHLVGRHDIDCLNNIYFAVVGPEILWAMAHDRVWVNVPKWSFCPCKRSVRWCSERDENSYRTLARPGDFVR